ncbi:MAG: hypothetical protein RL766_2138 [Bacteroidota bacterium]
MQSPIGHLAPFHSNVLPFHSNVLPCSLQQTLSPCVDPRFFENQDGQGAFGM